MFWECGKGINLRMYIVVSPITRVAYYEVRSNDQPQYIGDDLDDAIYEFNLLAEKTA